MAPLTHTLSSFCAVSLSFHSSSLLPSRGMEVLRRSTRVRLMQFKAVGLSNLLSLRSPHLSLFHLKDGRWASRRLTCTKASSSSLACSGTFLYFLHTCWKRCYQNHITLSYACQAGQNWIPFMLSYHLGSLSMSGYVGFLDVVLDPSYQLWLKVSWRCILNVCVVLFVYP
jgi:hypothetical protein